MKMKQILIAGALLAGMLNFAGAEEVLYTTSGHATSNEAIYALQTMVSTRQKTLQKTCTGTVEWRPATTPQGGGIDVIINNLKWEGSIKGELVCLELAPMPRSKKSDK